MALDHSIKINGKKFYPDRPVWNYVKKLERIKVRYESAGAKHADEVKALNETIVALRAKLDKK